MVSLVSGAKSFKPITSVVMGWYGAKPHQLAKMARFHESLGVGKVETFLYPSPVYFTADFESQRSLMENFVRDHLENKPNTNLVCHTLSNNGFLALRRLEELLRDRNDLKVSDYVHLIVI